MNQNLQKLMIPIAIIVAGALVAGAIIFTRSTEPASVPTQYQDPETLAIEAASEVTKTDHVRGDTKGALVTFVEYSDLDCPFCSEMHKVMRQVMQQNPDDVAWVYRHYPLTELHPEARNKAILSECIAKEFGNDAFWEYIDALFEGEANATKLAADMGLGEDGLADCLSDDKMAAIVDTQFEDAIATGGRGTPWTLIVLPDGSAVPLSGYRPYEVLQDIIDAVREQVSLGTFSE
jgi:protein-disulfide isomerase